VASAAALATLAAIEDEGLIARARDLEAHGLARLVALQAKHARFAEVRSFGAYFGVEIGGADAAEFADRLMYACLARGLSFKVGGGKVITLCPPLTIGFDDFDAAFDRFEGALNALEG
jgi:4-aminobutyrate aminotransferase